VNAATYTPLSATPPKRGIQTYACMLRWIRTSPMTSREVAKLMGTSVDNTVCILRWLHTKQVIHIHNWVVSEIATQRRAHEVWAFGPGKDAIPPTRADGSRGHYEPVSTLRVRLDLVSFAVLMHALADGCDTRTAMELTGCDRSRLTRDLRFMRSIRLVRIADWIRNPFGSPTPVYRIGSASSVGRPRPRTREESKRVCAAQRREQYHAKKLMRADPFERVALDVARRTTRSAQVDNQPA